MRSKKNTPGRVVFFVSCALRSCLEKDRGFPEKHRFKWIFTENFPFSCDKLYEYVSRSRKSLFLAKSAAHAGKKHAWARLACVSLVYRENQKTRRKKMQNKKASRSKTTNTFTILK